jgi:L-2-hydroxyglutarate oxidase LhgO
MWIDAAWRSARVYGQADIRSSHVAECVASEHLQGNLINIAGMRAQVVTK